MSQGVQILAQKINFYKKIKNFSYESKKNRSILYP